MNALAMPRKKKNIKFKAEKRTFFVKTELFDERVKLDNSVYVHCNFQGVIITPLVGLI